MRIRVIHRDSHGRFAKPSARRKLVLEFTDASTGKLLERREGKFSHEDEYQIASLINKRVTVKQIKEALQDPKDRPHVPGADTIKLEADGIFKVTIRSAETRTTLRIRKEKGTWRTIKKTSEKL